MHQNSLVGNSSERWYNIVMDELRQAQALFNKFQKNYDSSDLEEAMKILDNLISKSGEDSQKAINLKKAINAFMFSQLN
jgi:uncharacterized membrane protein YdfJ with MMPL/SSD domain